MPNCKEHRGCYLVCECPDGYYCFLEEHVSRWKHRQISPTWEMQRLVWLLRATILDPEWRVEVRQAGFSAGDRAAYEISELLADMKAKKPMIGGQ